MSAALRKLREDRGLKLQDMSDLLGLKTASAYYKKETGAVPITLEEAKIISDCFKMPMEKIFFPDNFPDKTI